MARVVKCPICNKTKKIKHNSYHNFVCCYTKFPIEENKQLEFNLEEQERTESKEIEATDLEIETDEEETEELEEEKDSDDYDFQCEDCGKLFDDEGNRNFFGGIKCPNCGLVSYEF